LRFFERLILQCSMLGLLSRSISSAQETDANPGAVKPTAHRAARRGSARKRVYVFRMPREKAAGANIPISDAAILAVRPSVAEKSIP
jgi:hypothetical protein